MLATLLGLQRGQDREVALGTKTLHNTLIEGVGGHQDDTSNIINVLSYHPIRSLSLVCISVALYCCRGCD